MLDNFEQLISAAPVVADLLIATPQLKIITSSRIALKIQSEREYPVPPLEMPQREATARRTDRIRIGKPVCGTCPALRNRTFP